MYIHNELRTTAKQRLKRKTDRVYNVYTRIDRARKVYKYVREYTCKGWRREKERK